MHLDMNILRVCRLRLRDKVQSLVCPLTPWALTVLLC